MKYCEYCGQQIADEAVVCVHCGCSTANYMVNQQPQVSDEPANVGLVILSVLFPIVGLILWAVQKSDSPRAAKAYGKAALISFCVGIAIYILYFIFVIGIMVSLM